MKKIMLMAAAVMAFAFAACDKHGSSDPNHEGFDSLFSQAQTDSLVLALATASGSQLGTQFANVQEQNPSLSRADFIKGLRYAMAADTATAFGYGMQSGMQLKYQLRQFAQNGLRVNQNAFIACFTKYFMSDSLDQFETSAAQEVANRLSRKLSQAEQKYQMAKLEQSEESMANIANGRKVVDSLIANDGYQATASGVAYKVLQAGEGDNVKANDRVKVAYTGKTLDGRTFDVVSPENARMQAVATRVPGLQEGLQKLQQGSKAMIYVPGREAFGVNPNNRYGLGPNETVVYEVEVLEIEQPK